MDGSATGIDGIAGGAAIGGKVNAAGGSPATTAIACRIDELHDVKQIALDIGRQQNRNVPLWEAVRLLIDTYRKAVTGGEGNTNRCADLSTA